MLAARCLLSRSIAWHLSVLHEGIWMTGSAMKADGMVFWHHLHWLYVEKWESLLRRLVDPILRTQETLAGLAGGGPEYCKMNFRLFDDICCMVVNLLLLCLCEKRHSSGPSVIWFAMFSQKRCTCLTHRVVRASTCGHPAHRWPGVGHMASCSIQATSLGGAGAAWSLGPTHTICSVDDNDTMG